MTKTTIFPRRALSLTLGLGALASLATLAGCGGGSDDAERSVASLRFIGQQVLPRRGEFQGTVVGGLSGIDYDAANARYVLISDDRTTTDSPNAPRFYTATLAFDANAFTSVQFTSTTPLKQPDGSVFPKVPDARVADPESIRIDPVNGNLAWASEGDRTLTGTPTRVIDPFVREMSGSGAYVRDYAVPAMFHMSAADTGPRGNLVFEGLAFTPDRKQLVVATEGALFADGPTPTVDAGSVSRFTVYHRDTGAAAAQYAYPIDKIQATPVPATAFSVNGPTEILAVTNTKFLVLERSFSVGVEGNQVRLYEVDTAGATDVLNTPALVGASYKPLSKRLVLNFNTLATQLGGIANLEGLTFGPKLANGHDSLVVVADDNFPTADSTTDRNQILVFEVLP
ncbi:MAG: hypothetical protein JWP29_1536 [Rhodoferax sp.]|nr:hypothetical protein [Rhodoferax sp.]